MVSIIIPYKNAAIFIAECIDSIISQSYKNWELILVNDNSSDESNSIVEQYCKIDRRIKNYNSNGVGIINALCTGYNHSKGDYITRMDADDVMHIDKIKLLRKALSNSGKNHVSIGLVNYFSSNKILGEGYIKYAKWLNYLTENKLNFFEIFKECTVPSTCWMLHRNDFDKIGGFENDKYPEDYDLAFRMFINGINISNVNLVIHHWRDHNLRTSRTDSKYDFKNFIPLKIEYLLKQKNNNSIVLWGTGKKGKLIAKELIKKEHPFIWITENTNKHGKEIYGQLIHETKFLKKEIFKTIICGVSSRNFTIPKNNKFNAYISFY